MKKLRTRLKKSIFCVLFVLFLGLIIASGSTKMVNFVSDLSSAISLKALHFTSKYDDSNEELQIRYVSNMDEVAFYGSMSPVSFTGQMTAYGPDCKGCGGKVACPPRQDVRNNNIYYQDSTYGTIRILAADKRIPCGSIIKISNLTFSSEPVLGIVLDRGGVIVGNIIDFLVPSEADSVSIGRQKNVEFVIVRWGW